MGGAPWPEDAKRNVVIVGAGFAGLSAAQALGRAPVRVTVVDHHNHHLFQPLLYQVATAALSASNIAAPIRHVLRKQENTQVILAEVQRIDLLQHRILLADGMLTFDQLIWAAAPPTPTSRTRTGPGSPLASRPSRTPSRSAAGS
jgi:NADH dehydrogenase